MNVKPASLGVICFVLTVTGCGNPQDDEIKKLMGQWKVVKVDGASLPEEPQHRIVTFTEKQVTLPFGSVR